MRLGYLSLSEKLDRKPRKKCEEETPTQKGVDVLLAVDMMNHAINKNMGKAILLSGDGDFTPLVQSIVQLGVFVQIIADKTTVSSRLTWVADEYMKLTFQNYYQMSTRVLQNKRPCPGVHDGRKTDFGHLEFKRGSIAGSTFDFGYINQEYIASFHEPFRSVVSRNEDDLILFLQMMYGPITWG